MERLTIEIDLRGKVSALGLRIAGEVDEATAPELRRILGDTTDGDGIVTVLLDLSGVTVMDRAGVDALLGADQQISGAGAAMRIVEASPSVTAAMDAAGASDRLAVTHGSSG